MHRCRCCTHPSTNFVQLTALAKIAGAEEKTYREVLLEISSTNNIINEYESKMPQKICRKCIKQLKIAYNFILQTRRVYEHYLRTQQESELHETLIEIPSAGTTYKIYEGAVENEASKSNENLTDEEEPRLEKVKIKCEVNEVSSPALVFDRTDDILCENEVKREMEDEGGTIDANYVDDSLEEREQADSATSSSCDEDEESVDEDYLLSSNEPIARCCDVCHKVYRDERALNIHKRFTHMPEEEKLPCPLCSYKTSRSSALKVHMGLIHGPEKVEEHFKPLPITGKKFPCNLCDRGYQRREDLRKHFRKKHKNPQMQLQPKRINKPPKPKGERCFLCAFCGQSYTSKKALDGHLLSHTGERPYQCDICDKAFKRIKDMKAHRVIHSDEKPFQCSNCSKSFKRADKLKIHMRVHSELRPYKCTECEKTFKYPSVLRTHMHMHTGQTPFSCKTCSEAFSLRTSLNNHCLKNGHVK